MAAPPREPLAPPAPKAAGRQPLSAKAIAGTRARFLYVIFALALLPLGFQAFSDETDVEARIEHTIASHPEVVSQLEGIDSIDDLLALFPDNRIEGAHLARETWTHWAYALIAALAFLGVVRLLFEPGRSTVAQLFIAAAVTGTIGILSLLIFQWIAEFSQGVWLHGGSIIVVVFYIVKFIGFSYHAALDPSNGFWLSFLGFTCGVGLCEEVTKALPVITWLRNDAKLGWRAACVIGLASGVGFGVAEGIMYASQYYNGVMSMNVYLTRFISCVALHTTWTAAVAVVASQNLAGFDTGEAWDWFLHLLRVVAVSAVLHGLYDTLLKRELPGYALLTALASFLWLTILLERARAGDPQRSPRAMAGVPV